MLLAYAGVIAASSVDSHGVSLRRGLRRGLPVVGATGLAMIAGGAVTPALLPWLPGHAFSAKGVSAEAVLAAGTALALRGRLSPAASLALLAGVPALDDRLGAADARMDADGASHAVERAGPALQAGAAVDQRDAPHVHPTASAAPATWKGSARLISCSTPDGEVMVEEPVKFMA